MKREMQILVLCAATLQACSYNDVANLPNTLGITGVAGVRPDNASLLSSLETEGRIAEKIEAELESRFPEQGPIRVRFAPVENVSLSRSEGDLLVPVTVLAVLAENGEDRVVYATVLAAEGLFRDPSQTNVVAAPPAYAAIPAMAAVGLRNPLGILALPFIAVGDLVGSARESSRERERRTRFRDATVAGIGGLVTAGVRADALTLIKAASRDTGPIDAVGFYLRGERARLDGDSGRARSEFSSALDLSPDFLPALRGLVAVLPPEETEEAAIFRARVATVERVLAAELAAGRNTHANMALDYALNEDAPEEVGSDKSDEVIENNSQEEETTKQPDVPRKMKPIKASTVLLPK